MELIGLSYVIFAIFLFIVGYWMGMWILLALGIVSIIIGVLILTGK